jgi:uncharacterized iron-regulated membrane protein
MRNKSLRKIWWVLHKWLGLCLGFFIALLGLTGTLLLFTQQMIEVQHGALVRSAAVPPEQWHPPAQWIEAAVAMAGPRFTPNGMSAPNASPIGGDAVLVIGHLDDGTERADWHLAVAVHPAGDAIGKFYLEKTWAMIPRAIHATLAIPHIGLEIVAVLGLISIVSVVSGLYLWWPSRRPYASSLRFRRGGGRRGLIRQLHTLPAIYFSIVFALLGLTGALVAKPQWASAIIGDPGMSATTGRLGVDRAACANPTRLIQAIDVALASHPERRFAYALSPEGSDVDFRVNLWSPSDIDQRDGDLTVHVSAECPRIIGLSNIASERWSERFLSAMLPVHGGHFAGLSGMIVVGLAGIFLPMLFITGIFIYIGKRPRRGKRGA